MVGITSSGFGVSTAALTEDAVAEALAAAKAAMNNGGDGIALAFVSSTVTRNAAEVRQCFVKALPENTPIHGITSSSAILTTTGAKAGGVACLLIGGDVSSASSFATAFNADSAQDAAAALHAKMSDPQAIFMSTTPGAEESVIAALGARFHGVPAYGGTAADDVLDGSWSVFGNEGISGTGISLVGIGKSVGFGASMVGPYTPTKTTCVATKADGRRVYEIDGTSAKDWVYAWLGDDVKEQYTKGGLILPQTAQKPIGIKQASPSDEFTTLHLAALGGIDETYVDFFAPVPQNATLTVMDSGDGPATGYAAALRDAYDIAKANLGDTKVKAGLLIFCGGMAIAVGDALDTGLTDPDFVSKLNGVPLMGMTCFGEQAHLAKTHENVQRNLSVGLILFG